MKTRIQILFALMALSTLRAGETTPPGDSPIGIRMALQHYEVTKKKREKLRAWPDKDFQGSPREVPLNKKVNTRQQVLAALQARPEKLKKKHRIHSIVEQRGFFVVVLHPPPSVGGGKYDGKRLHHAYLIQKTSSHLVYWMNW